MKQVICIILFLLSIQSLVGQQCDVVVTSKAALKKDLADILDNLNIRLDGNNSCSKTCVDIDRKIDRLQAELNELKNEKLNEMMDEIQRILIDKVSSLQAQLKQLHLPGMTPSQPAASCANILRYIPNSPSGYYWIEAHKGLPNRRFCNMSKSCGGVSGGWMRVAELDMRNSSQQCPSGLRQRSDSNIRTCGINSNSPACSSVTFPVKALEYSKVCGKIKAYQYGSPDSFGDTGRGINPNINTYYVDGISLTLGNPRRHLWTFAAALDEVGSRPDLNCPCTKRDQANRATQSPAFVGNDYFCDTASANRYQFIFYADDPLWDGAGCGHLNTCCSFNNPPWFYKQLPQPTTDDIELRVCTDQGAGDEDIAIEMLDIYVQ